MEDRQNKDLARLRAWASGDVRVSRGALVAGAAVLLLCAGLALD